MITIDTQNTAVIAVDAQKCFMPGDGPGFNELPAPEGDQVAEPLAAMAPLGRIYAASGDQHPADHQSFQDVQVQGPRALDGIWPRHGEVGTPGAELHPLVAAQVTEDWMIAKGTTAAEEQYSAFGGADAQGRTLHEKLIDEGITTLLVGGLVTNVCVQATVNDALDLGYRVIVIEEAVRGIPGGGDIPTPEEALQQMQEAGAELARTVDEIGVAQEVM